MNKKFKEKLKNKISKQTVFGFILGAIIFGTIGVSAASVLYSKDVTYDNTSSGLSATTVQEALDELYEQAKNAGGCPEGYSCIETAGAKLVVSEGVVTSGDGLYADSATSGRYIYRGTSVNNYITFNGETWRIISVESDGTIKIIRNEQLSSTYAWDTAGTRSSSTSTYCTSASSYGCSAWAATANLVGTPSTFIQYYQYGNPSNYSNTYSGTVVADASLNTYLNGTYYNSLSDKTKVVKGTFNVSTPGNASDTETLEVNAEQEKQYQWQGYVALMTVTELLRTSTSSGCTSLKAGFNIGNSSTCSSNNWLWPTSNAHEWTLSPYVRSNRNGVWYVSYSGYVDSSSASSTRGVRPVLFLSSSITLKGSGKSNDHYTIN